MPEAGWFADPHGRHELRYWDGGAWTDWVADAGEQYCRGPDSPRQRVAVSACLQAHRTDYMTGENLPRASGRERPRRFAYDGD
ncbi:MAG: DUF2510 domain-containing protein [Acidimicrobiaceae bacterium]|nr:DUF2510 domain-containing protein [Acidimicrobiaceae bacterium]